jgi:hypothetical protein
MDVEDTLSRLAVRVEDRPVPTLVVAVLLRECSCESEHRSHQRIVLDGQVVQGGDVLLGNNQHMQRRLRIDVLERHQGFILVHQCARDVARDDLAEETVGHKTPGVIFSQSHLQMTPGVLGPVSLHDSRSRDSLDVVAEVVEPEQRPRRHQ